MEPEHRPLPVTTFPWARAGFAAGVALAIFGALAREEDRRVEPPAALDAPAPVERAVEAPPARVDARTPFVAPAIPWPAGEQRERSTSSSSGNGEMRIEAGLVALAPAAVEAHLEQVMASCAPTRAASGARFTSTCESASEESAAVVAPRDATSTWLRTSRTTFVPPRGRPQAARVRGPDVDVDAIMDGSCGYALRFVALPAGARVTTSGGSDTDGHCRFDVEGRAAVTWATMLKNVFRPGTHVAKRALDDGVVSRWTAEAWDGDAWWRVDVVTASADESRAQVHVHRWAPGTKAWHPPFGWDEKVAALEQCWEPCALAWKDKARATDDVAKQMRTRDAIDRCLFECHGVEQAPAVVEQAR